MSKGREVPDITVTVLHRGESEQGWSKKGLALGLNVTLWSVKVCVWSSIKVEEWTWMVL